MLSEKNQLFTNDHESLNRPAWVQTLEQGCGSGLGAFKHKQVHKADGVPQYDYYTRSRGHR